jgi:UDP-glucose 4-epimerase
MARFLVTGGGGFIGSHLVDRLLSDGHEVRVIDDFSTGRRENLSHLAGHPSLEVIEGDICQEWLLGRAMEGVHYVLHQAAIPSVPRSVEDPWTSHRVNAEGTLKVLIKAKEAGVKRVIFASSSSVYGNVEGEEIRPKRENLPPSPLSPYAATKLTGEGYCRAFFASYGLETVVLRYFNIFGPRQDPSSHYASVIPRFASALKEGRPPTIYGDGRQTRDFTFVENVVEANLRACFAEEAPGRVFNIACGRSISVLQLLEAMSRVAGVKPTPEFAPPRPGDVRHSLADITLAEGFLGYRPKVDFEEGLRRTLSHFGLIEDSSSSHPGGD